VTVWRTAVVGDLWAAVVWLPVAVLLNVPLMTAVWVYLALLLGLHRLGRRTLSLAAFPQDLSLGLGEVGRLAFTAFWIYGAGFAPLLVVNFTNPIGPLFILGLFLVGVVVSSPAWKACTDSCWLSAVTTWHGPGSCTPVPMSPSDPGRWPPWGSRPSSCRLPR
jgi:hypothetical protein